MGIPNVNSTNGAQYTPDTAPVSNSTRGSSQQAEFEAYIKQAKELGTARDLQGTSPRSYDSETQTGQSENLVDLDTYRVTGSKTQLPAFRNLTGPGTANPASIYNPEPDVPIGRNTSTTSNLPEGGKIVTTLRSAESLPDQGYSTPPTRIDLRYSNGEGIQGALRLTEDGTAQAAWKVSDNPSVVLTGQFNPTFTNGVPNNPVGTILGATIVDPNGIVGARVEISNPFGANNPVTGQEGAQGSRVEIFTAFGSDTASNPTLNPQYQLGVYAAQSQTPGSEAGFDEIGVFGRISTFQIPANSPVVTGDAGLTIGQRQSTNAAGSDLPDTSFISGSLNLTIGREGGVQGRVEAAFTETSAPTGDDFRVYGEIRVPLR